MQAAINAGILSEGVIDTALVHAFAVTYATSDPTVATVSSAGLVKAVGAATITVTVNGVSGSCPIVVR